MKYSLEIGKIIEGSFKYDLNKVKNYTNLLIDKLKKDGDSLAATKFERIRDQIIGNNISYSNISNNSVPIDQESKIKLADIYYPIDNNFETVLNSNNEMEINSFINSVINYDKLNKYGLARDNSLLLFGPPGCGKTNCAFMIAKKLNLPIVVARLDSLISSYLGTTSKNIRLLFDYVSKTPCVLFLDEFDAIAKARDDKNELGELKRVVNTLLQNIDSISNDSVIIAATNHDQLLDSAVWRRFEYRVKLDKPDLKSRICLFKLFTKQVMLLSDKEALQLAACFEGESGSCIKNFVNKTFKKCVLENKKMNASALFDNLFLYNIGESNKSFTNKDKIFFLYSINNRFTNEKIFTYQDIAEIVNVSKPYVSMILKGDRYE